MKKALKIIVGSVVIIILALLLLPVLFQDKIETVLKEKINENVNAKVVFADLDLSFIRNFPNASVKLKDISVINKKPFEGDTLFYGKELNLKLSLTSVFGDKIAINSFEIDEAKVNVITNKKGQVNYDIAKKSSSETPTEEKSSEEKSTKIVSVKSYAITNSDINYIDEKGKMTVRLSNFNHSGKGDFSADRTELDTQTASTVFFEMDKKAYADNLHLDLKALLDLDLVNNKFSFLKNEAHINQLPLIFQGFVIAKKDSQEIDLTFKTPSSDFKNFLGLVPKMYAKNITDVKTSGNFDINGAIKGIADNKHIPKINIAISSNNASFKYPDLPKSVSNIHINTTIKNTTGLIENTYVDINNISFKIDDNTFKAVAKIQQLTTNPLVNATAKGKLNLAHIDKVYPIEMKNQLSGIITADLTTKFDVNAVQKNIYQRIKNNGKLSVNDFVYSSKDIVNPITIKNAEVDFKPTKISLTNFDAKTGTTDLKASGTIDNLLGFLLSNKELKGNFAVNSDTFRVSDFMEADTDKKEVKKEKSDKTETPTSSESLKIPAFLNIVTKVNVKTAYYDNLELKNVTGVLILKDKKAILKDVNAAMFDGNIALNGAVNTQKKTPSFDLKMDIKSFNISKSFEKLAMLDKLAPIANVIQGKLNTSLNVKGDLKNDFTPNLNSIKGDAFAQMLNQKIDPSKSKAMNLLSNKLSFVDLKNLNLKDVKTQLDFKDGKVHVKPFKINYKDIDINIGGSHSFDQNINYNVTFDVPAKYLGSEVSSLLSKLDAKSQNTKVPITANLTGNFDNPSVSTDMSSAVSSLTSKLIEQQKNKLIGNALGGLLGGEKKEKDSTKTDIKKKAGNILGGFFKKKSK